MKNNEIIVGYCGLVCTNCWAYRKKKCRGCYSEQPMYKNCPVKQCCIEKSYTTCAECIDYSDLKKCKKLNNYVAKIVGFIFKTNKIDNLKKIRQIGLKEFKQTIKHNIL